MQIKQLKTAILDGISMNIKFDDFPYIICQYKYYKQIIDLYRYFGLVPTMKFNSRKIIVFENEFLTCILATMNLLNLMHS